MPIYANGQRVGVFQQTSTKPEQSKTVTPTASGLTVIPDSGKTLGSVVVNGDVNLIAENIKKDVTIFGVTGTHEGGGESGGDFNRIYIQFIDASTGIMLLPVSMNVIGIKTDKSRITSMSTHTLYTDMTNIRILSVSDLGYSIPWITKAEWVELKMNDDGNIVSTFGEAFMTEDGIITCVDTSTPMTSIPSGYTKFISKSGSVSTLSNFKINRSGCLTLYVTEGSM